MPNVYSKQRFLAVTNPVLPRSYHAPDQDLETQKLNGEENNPKLSPAMEQPGPCPVNEAADRASRDGASDINRSAMKALLNALARANEKGTCYGTVLSQREVINLTDATDALKSYLILFQFHGFDFSVANHSDMLKQCTKMLKDVITVFSHGYTWIDYFKYKNASFFAAWNKDQVLPPEPAWLEFCALRNPKYLLGGPFYRWLHRLFGTSEDARRKLSLSILQSKGGMPRPNESMVEAAEDKAVRTMTSVKPQEDFEVHIPLEEIVTYHTMEARDQGVYVDRSEFTYSPKVTYKRAYMERQIRRTTGEIFRNFDLTLETLSNFILPSNSANYNRSRSQFGAWGEISDVMVRTQKDKALFTRDSLPRFEAVMMELRDSVSERYGPEGQMEQFCDRMLDVTRQVLGCAVKYGEFLAAWRVFFWRCVAFAYEHEQEAFCEVVGLAESLKIRTISKGPPVTYFVLKPLQHAMWSQLQKYWNFELTGTPITEELMNKRFRRFLDGGYRFHSGDYSAATDELQGWVSETIANTIVDIWDKNAGFDHTIFRWLFLNSLTGHTYVHKGEHLPQRRGQLMGSITSFPVLCLANASLLRAAYETSHNIVVRRFEDLPVWINGDDCLTAYYSETFPMYWRGFGQVMGFKESVGKTYDSPEFCSINSTTFDVHEDRWRLRKYVNLRLIYGHVRSSVGSNAVQKRAHQLGPIHRKLIDMTPEELIIPVHRMFMERHMDVLKTYPGPWFLPEYLCGLGLVNVEKIEQSHHELLVVSALRVLYGKGEQLPPTPIDSDWHLYDIFHKYCRTAVPMLDSYYFESYSSVGPLPRGCPYCRDSPKVVDDSSYGQAFKAVILAEFVLNYMDNIWSKPEKDEKRCYQKRLELYRKACTFVKENPDLRPADRESIDYEKKIRTVPIIGIDTIARSLRV